MKGGRGDWGTWEYNFSHKPKNISALGPRIKMVKTALYEREDLF